MTDLQRWELLLNGSGVSYVTRDELRTNANRTIMHFSAASSRATGTGRVEAHFTETTHRFVRLEFFK